MRGLVILLFVGLIVLSGLVVAQPEAIILTVGLDELTETFIADDFFADFEAAHPGVKIVVNAVTFAQRDLQPPQTVREVDYFLDRAERFVSLGDVLSIDSRDLSLELVRARVLLDLAPLLAADPDATLADFNPALLDTFRWDGALLALPVSGAANILAYDRMAFDTAGLAYPTAEWTTADFMRVGEILDSYLPKTRIELLLRALLNRSIDPLAMADDAELLALLEQWKALYPLLEASGGFDNPLPLRISGSFMLEAGMSPASVDYAGALLPGNTAGLDAHGFAVSAGTQYPELAYALAQYMTTREQSAAGYFSDTYARQSMGEFPTFGRDAATDALVNDALRNPLTTQEVFAFGYVVRALDDIAQNETNAQIALQTVQRDLQAVLEAIDTQRANTVVAVSTPIPTAVPAEGITLRFGANLSVPLPNGQRWNAAINEFLAQNPEIGQIIFDRQPNTFEHYIKTQDCFYTNNAISAGVDTSQLYNLLPLMAADPDFDGDDFLSGVLRQVSTTNGVWAVPMDVNPIVIWYNRRNFQDAGLPEPAPDWTTSEFDTALRALGEKLEGVPLRTEVIGNTYILMLVASYGGLLVDYRTLPRTYDFTSEASINATRDVLNLGREKLINYQSLSSSYGGHFGGEAPIMMSYLRTDDYRLQRSNTYGILMLPRGSTYTPMSYGIGAAYISATTPHPEACYAWIRFLAQQTGLLFGMPARHSMLTADAQRFEIGEDVLAFYRAFAAALDLPNVVVFESRYTGGELYDPVEGMAGVWLSRVFDNYVLHEGDLEADLTAASGFLPAYQECIATIEPPSRPIETMSIEQRGAYYSQFTDCTITVDPSAAERLGR